MFEALQEPITIAGLAVPNRIVRTAHSLGKPWVDVDDSLVAYHQARARGGVGLSILETGMVHPTAPRPVPSHDDRVLDGYRRLAVAIHRHHSTMMQQLWHGGSSIRNNPLGGSPWSASDVPNPLRGVVPIPMTKTMIDDVVAGFAAAARRVQLGGLDGVEIHGAHGYLVGQFLSPMTNLREDDYGGDVAGRARFLVEILDAIRAEVGPDFPVGVRLSADEQVPGGLEPKDTLFIAQHVEHLVDFVDLSIGSYYRFHRMMAPADAAPTGYELPLTEAVSRALNKPTIVSGRITTLDHANHIVASGAADMVSMVRALIADPDLIAKTMAGHAEQVRPCTGTNQGCVGGIREGNFGCVVNPAAGKEARWTSDPPDRAATSRKVLIAGGGAAGLEAARTAALRGHDVVLVEASRRLGGQVNAAAAAPHRAEFGAITHWLHDEVRRLGVRVRMATFVEPDLIDHEKPDVIIVATGSSPRRDGRSVAIPSRSVPGVTLPHVHSVWDLFGMGRRVEAVTAAVVYDDTGGWEAISAAEELLARGAKVTLATRFHTFGETVPDPPSTVDAARERLLNHRDFTLAPDSIIDEIGTAAVTLGVLGSARSVRYSADCVVIVDHRDSNRELADLLLETFDGELHVVGDANGGRTLRQAITEAATVGRAI
jgi:2,4-dienoyl-CoA reductase-like NADH-dependent reductase (Old Yellow Enzyme family)/thioredoxin reductase